MAHASVNAMDAVALAAAGAVSGAGSQSPYDVLLSLASSSVRKRG